MNLRLITNYSKDIAASVAEKGSVVGFWDIRVSVEGKYEYRFWEQKKGHTEGINAIDTDTGRCKLE